MKTKSQTILALTLLASLAACSKAAPTGVTKSTDAADAFQKKSISRVGLVNKLALTFDDGPHEVHTPRLLDILEEAGIKATFFVNGKNVPGNESIMKRMHDDGHVVASHAQTHEHLPTVAATQGMRALFHQVMDTHLLIKPYLQRNGRMYFRAPFGAWKSNFAPYLNQDQVLRDYIGPMFWDIGGEISRDPKTKKVKLDSKGNPLTAADWDCWTNRKGKPTLTLKQCAGGYYNETSARGGGIVLLHDKTANTVDMTARLIPIWKKAGFKFVTLDEIQSLDQYADEGAILKAQAQENRNVQ